MHPRLRTGLIVAAILVVAAWLGAQVAEGSYGWPALAATLTLAAVLVRFTGVDADAIFVGFLLVGYIVGNRGFAQLMPAPGLPLLPAEAGLLIAVGWRVIVCAFERRLPVQRDLLNWTVAAWIVAGTARVAFDVPRFGMLALRDYAMIYYAAFFFLAQHMARDARVRRYFVNCLLVGGIVQLPVFILYQFFPSVFLNQLTILGAPLVYYKGDLAFTFLAASSLLIFHWATGRQRTWAWPLAAVMFLYVMSADNRASLLGAVTAAGLLLLAGRWRFAALQGGLTVVALGAVIALAAIGNNNWAQGKLHGLSDRLHSLTDVSGTGHYTSEESSFKGDNNRFRLIWWKNVIEETGQANPVFGLGFGADLAAGFLQEYYPDNSEEFGVRSPHNMFVTTFGRMGAAGLGVWLVFCAAFLQRAWRALSRTGDPVTWSLWCMAWVILVSATFGVVLEGPMGAVIFWTVLGLASATPAEVPAADQPSPEPAPAELVAN